MPPKKKNSTGGGQSSQVSATEVKGSASEKVSTPAASEAVPVSDVTQLDAKVSNEGLHQQDDFMTVIVTPKLSFQICKKSQWKFVEDIPQDELRRGFLSRFPPALWMSSEKFSFRPALPPSSQITEETTSLVFKIVSDEVADERILLSILRELEKSYEAIIRRAVNETRSESLQEQLSLQAEADELRREQEKQVKELRKENKGMRDQLQSIQKRLFLVEQEKDQLRKEQQALQDRTARLERQNAEQAKSFRSESDELRDQLETMRLSMEAFMDASARPKERRKVEVSVEDSGTALSPRSSSSMPQGRPVRSKGVDAASQTDSPMTEVEPKIDSSILPAVVHRVDSLQQQLGYLQGWLLQGSQLLQAPLPISPTPTSAAQDFAPKI
eukprot:TRINITY_DN33157_c0_g2_i1.p1 TRINITY_DN33157_c0_g2~~TRINITY_DN33157_c0_g2_i1.p1  ORF type:complete len:385 (+),score=85.39 TRINITY_DN33157_c0_g2_i1:36-1190(+)